MNQGSAARRYLRHHHHAAAITLIGVDCDGFDARADGVLLRFDFSEPVTNAQDLRAALIAMADRARA